MECLYRPELRDKPMAVGGDPENRHGIILTKNEIASKYGLIVGEPLWKARQKCPDLVVVPPNYPLYLRFSALTRKIYEDYSEFIEPFGLDECWLDVTGSEKSGEEIAHEIRKRVKSQLGITVSVGVSFNKVFAKLGSDMNKPDGITVITRQNYRDTVWRMPCAELLFCSNATAKRLAEIGIYTVGDMAAAEPEVMQRCLGRKGLTLWSYARGLDSSPVISPENAPEAKSVGHGITCVSDIDDPAGAERVIYALAQSIGGRLRGLGLSARGVHVTAKNNALFCRGWQKKISPTQSESDIAATACELLSRNYRWQLPIRALTVTAIELVSEREPEQTSLFCSVEDKLRSERLGRSIDKIRKRYGGRAIVPAVVLGDDKLPSGRGHDIFGEIFDPFGGRGSERDLT